MFYNSQCIILATHRIDDDNDDDNDITTAVAALDDDDYYNNSDTECSNDLMKLTIMIMTGYIDGTWITSKFLIV